jgi:hypothetical protein
MSSRFVSQADAKHVEVSKNLLSAWTCLWVN